MNLSFQEKSLWVVFLGLIAASGWYCYTVSESIVPTELAVDVMPDQVALFIAAVVLLIIVQIVGHIAIAVGDRRSEMDERDRLIGLKGTRNGAFVLATGAFFALSAAMMTKGNFVSSHVLLGFWVLAQLTETGSQLFLYRRGR